tara:strand:- start:3952 stop:5451 length:1500 start_codon:yes stop_codon:yes gene_type:complete
MAVPIFNRSNPAFAQRQQQLMSQALQLGATPSMLNVVTRGAVSPNYTLPSVFSQNVPVGSEFDVDFNAPSSRYVPDQRSAREILSSSTSPFALIGKGVGGVSDAVSYLANLRAPSYDPVANRQATQSLINQRAIDTGILQDEYNLDKERRIADANISQYIPNIFKARAPSYVVGGSQGMQDTQEMGMARDAAAIQQDIDSDGLVYQSRDSIVKSLQAGEMTADEAKTKLEVVKERQRILDKAVQNQGQRSARSARFDKDRKELLESLGEDTTIKRGVSPSGTTDDTFKEKTPEEKSQGLQTAKIQTKLKDTSALDNSAGKGSGADNWFDAVNERVDLMAMGAAMLAGSGSGMGTASNFGQALQTGLGARASQAKTAQDKAYKDQLLTLRALEASSAMAKNKAAALADPFKNEGAKINAIVAQLQAANIEGEPAALDALAALINTTDPSFVTAPQELRSNALDYFAKEYGNNWFSDGGEIDITEARKGYLEALKSLSGTK